MSLTPVKKSWNHQIKEVTIGTGESAVTVGGETTLPFLHDEGDMPNPPRIALDVFDAVPDTWTEDLIEATGDEINDPVEWAQKGVEEWGVELISLNLTQHALEEDPASPEDCAKLAEEIAEATGLPMIVWGAGEEEPDRDVYPVVSQALSGQRCLLGSASEESYKTLTATCIADGHNIIGESPIDINICKQVNILVTDMGMSEDRIVVFPTNGALGYGLEYAYSILERTRLAALGGDRMMAMPIIIRAGTESQRSKEVKAKEDEFPEWGSRADRGIVWEATTATSYLQAGADIVTMNHPEAIRLIRQYIDTFMNTE